MLRILLVLPFYGGSLPVGRFCAAALEELGCLVEVFDAPAFNPAYEAINDLKVSPERLDSLHNSFLQIMAQGILAKVESFEPDLVLSMAQAPLNRRALQRLRKDGVATAMWFVEDYRLFTYWRAFAPFYDIFAVIQKEPFDQELAKLGVANVLYLPLAAQPTLHRPLDLSAKERREFGADVAFMGAGYPNRRVAFSRMVREDSDFARRFALWGTQWDGEEALKPLLRREGARVSPEDCVRIFNAATINLNLHSSVQTDRLVSGGDFVNPRTFEIAACGGFQLVDERGLLPELFDPDEMATFRDLGGLREGIRHFLTHPEERRAYAEKARQRALREHTYAHRMQRLLDFARERLPGFGARKDVAWPDDMPEDMRHSIEALMLELRLPPSAGFDTMVTAVRGKSEPLSDAEAALLFLDEWRKLYG